MRYVTIDISTEQGLRRAERLKAHGKSTLPNGYEIVTVGIDKIQFSVPKGDKHGNKRSQVHERRAGKELSFC